LRHGVQVVAVLLPFYGHYTGQTAWAGTPVKNWRIVLEQTFTPPIPRRPQTSHALDDG